jgi:hypothetical protein
VHQVMGTVPGYQDHLSWNNTAACSSRKR